LLKVAIASDRGYVSEHFGHCPEYADFTVEGNTVTSRMVVPNPGHQPGFLPVYLGRLGVTHVIAGGMGYRAQQLFREQGIEPILGATGRVEEVLDAFVAGTLERGESLCQHEGEGGSCQGG
jgi:predicted Fe-Mo cluster-binding NifX family protein